MRTLFKDNRTPYCWQSLPAIERIIVSQSRNPSTHVLLAVYTAITFVESKNRTLPTIAQLGSCLSLSRKTISHALKELAALGLIALERQGRCEIVSLLDVGNSVPEIAVKTARNGNSVPQKLGNNGQNGNSVPMTSLFGEKRKYGNSVPNIWELSSHIKNCATDSKSLRNHDLHSSRPVENFPKGYKDKNKDIYRATKPKKPPEGAQWNLETFYRRLKVIRVSDAANQEGER
jgi:DNA-binding transcriptional ArsR family regulator